MFRCIGDSIHAERDNLYLAVGVDCGEDFRDVVHLSDHAGIDAGAVLRQASETIAGALCDVCSLGVEFVDEPR